MGSEATDGPRREEYCTSARMDVVAQSGFSSQPIQLPPAPVMDHFRHAPWKPDYPHDNPATDESTHDQQTKDDGSIDELPSTGTHPTIVSQYGLSNLEERNERVSVGLEPPDVAPSRPETLSTAQSNMASHLPEDSADAQAQTQPSLRTEQLGQPCDYAAVFPPRGPDSPNRRSLVPWQMLDDGDIGQHRGYANVLAASALLSIYPLSALLTT